MLPHQERVIQEKIELDERLHELGEFILNDSRYITLPIEEVSRLNRQMNIMSEYSIVLLERIVAFEQEGK